jgi:transposase
VFLLERGDNTTLARAPNGQAIRASRRAKAEVSRLTALLEEAEAESDLKLWRRCRSVLDYIAGRTAIEISDDLGVSRSGVTKWLAWFDTMGADGLRSGKPTGRPPRLTEAQKEELAKIIEAGPQSIGLTSGLWIGPAIGDLIRRKFGVKYHRQYIPRLLHDLGFSVQRPRKRLARADVDAQAYWLNERLPAIKKKPPPAGASSSSRTKRASGSTGRSTKHGPA